MGLAHDTLLALLYFFARYPSQLDSYLDLWESRPPHEFSVLRVPADPSRIAVPREASRPSRSSTTASVLVVLGCGENVVGFGDLADEGEDVGEDEGARSCRPRREDEVSVEREATGDGDACGAEETISTRTCERNEIHSPLILDCVSLVDWHSCARRSNRLRQVLDGFHEVGFSSERWELCASLRGELVEDGEVGDRLVRRRELDFRLGILRWH